jgi:hypothetical protein
LPGLKKRATSAQKRALSVNRQHTNSGDATETFQERFGYYQPINPLAGSPPRLGIIVAQRQNTIGVVAG